jgi:hypothetical protein
MAAPTHKMLATHTENDRPFQAIPGPKDGADQILRSVALAPRMEWRGLDPEVGHNVGATPACHKQMFTTTRCDARLTTSPIGIHTSGHRRPNLRFNCDESQLGGVELREPLSPRDDQSLNVLAGDVAPEWASFDVTRSVTDSSRPARFYDVLNGTILAGTAMGVFVPEAVSTGMGSRRRQNSTRPTRGSDGTDQKRRSSGYAGPRASIARQPMASTRPGDPYPGRDNARRGSSADDARNRREIREIGATDRAADPQGRRGVGHIGPL